MAHEATNAVDVISASYVEGKERGAAVGGAVGSIAGPMATAVGEKVGGVGGGIVGGAVGVYRWFRAASERNVGPERITPTVGPTMYTIDDKTWEIIWTNLQSNESKKRSDYLKQPEVTNQTEERRAKEMCDRYDTAIRNGVGMMSCGRVCVLGVSAERNWIPIGIENCGIYTLDRNNTLCLMSEEGQLKGLATLANAVIIQNQNPDQYKDFKELMKAVKAFQIDIPHIQPNVTVEDKIRIAVKNIYSSDSTTTPPSLIHATCHSREQLKHMLPLFITSRSLFIVEVNHAEREEAHSNDDKIITSVREDVYRCIECITGTLLEKARKLYEMLYDNELLNPALANKFLCPYPKIVIVGTHISDNGRSQVQSTIENIEKWVRLNCSDAAREKKITVVNTVDQSADDCIQALLTDFITKDLIIPTPLSWELFRQMFSYVTKNVPIIPIEIAATIASLCDIATDDFPSVLNFYHEHGAFLYYADVECLRNIIIIDPKWLQEKLSVIHIANQPLSPMWERLTTQGILVAPLCEELWHSEEVKNLPSGMVKLLEKYHLAAPIAMDQEMCDFIGDKYFVPFVLKSKGDAQLYKMPDRLYTAPIHITFPKIKHLPPGIFNCLIVALASKKRGKMANGENENFRIDFKCEMLCDQISFWFGHGFRDKVILRDEITSISVVVERLKYCGDEYLASNFWLTCQKILTSLATALKQAVQQVWNIEAKLAFCCTCQSSEGGLPHYVSIDTDTKSTCNTLRCEENREYTLNGDEHWWLKMADTHYKVGKVFKSEVNYLAASLTQKADQERLIQALEITSVGTGSDFTLLMNGWADTTGPDARIHLVYHLIRINLREVADGINKGRHRTNVNIENDPKQGKVHTIYA